MANQNQNSSSSPGVPVLLVLLLLLILSPTVLAKSRRPISDIETRQKSQCYADIERNSGLWGWQCKSSLIAKENCALQCLSPTCYELVYESDPLEEGEKDLIRGQEFKYCMHKLGIRDDVLAEEHATHASTLGKMLKSYIGRVRSRIVEIMVIFGRKPRGY